MQASLTEVQSIQWKLKRVSENADNGSDTGFSWI